jgi:hypothetical protein
MFITQFISGNLFVTTNLQPISEEVGIWITAFTTNITD